MATPRLTTDEGRDLVRKALEHAHDAHNQHPGHPDPPGAHRTDDLLATIADAATSIALSLAVIADRLNIAGEGGFLDVRNFDDDAETHEPAQT